MATLNIGIKISGAVSGTATSAAGALATAYTAPANSYAQVNVQAVPSGNTIARVLVGGRPIAQPQTASGVPISLQGVIVGPGQSVQVDGNTGGVNIVLSVAGVLLTNTI